MSFYEVIARYRDFDFAGYFAAVTPARVEAALARETLSELDLLTLLSPAASSYLEPMARRAQRLTEQHFGRTIQLFIPLYISNFCTNECLYCGFHRGNRIGRRKLGLAEIEAEARAIAATGMRHLLLLTGEAPELTPLDYLEDAVRLLRSHFSSVAVEIFPLDQEGYGRLRSAGVDGLTLYQEVYDEVRYRLVHRAGRKTDYRFRLDGPERGARAGLRQVNIGPLLGLGEVRPEVFMAGLHARYLMDNFLQTEVGLSLPRINPAEGGFQPEFVADDRSFVQSLVALRCFLPRAGITISTRESARLRDRLLLLGATRFSAGSCTGVGGYAKAEQESTPQFRITDERPVDQVVAAIRRAGYQPVFKDWDRI